MEFFGIEEVEDLEHDEGIEDEGEMSGNDHGLLVNSLIIPSSIDLFHSSASDGSTDNSVVPFVIRMGGKDCGVERVH